MSDNNLLILNSQIKNKVEELSNNNIVESLDSSIYSKIIESKSSLSIKIQNKLSNINLDISSVKRIFSYNQLDYIKYISLIQDKEELNMNIEVNSLSESLTIPVNRKTEKEINEETTEEDTTIKEDDLINDEKNKNNVSISVKIKNDNIYDPNFPLLKNKIDNTFSNIDKVPQKYLSLIICGNKAIINLDYLKCIYPTIFCCGIFNLLYCKLLNLSKNSLCLFFYLFN